MRDPKRIPVVLKTIEELWLRHPDQRFGQLCMNYIFCTSRDPFYIEDDDLLEFIKENYNG